MNRFELGLLAGLQITSLLRADGCAFDPKILMDLPSPTPVPTSVIRNTDLLPGAKTEVIAPQFWYRPTNQGFERTASATPTHPAKNESVRAAGPELWYAPASAFTDVSINNQAFKTDMPVQSGKYSYFPLTGFAGRAIAITPNELMGGKSIFMFPDKSMEAVGLYEIAAAGNLILRGVLVEALLQYSIQGGMQDLIEGPMVIRVKEGDFYKDLVIDRSLPQQQIQVINAAAKTTEYASDTYAHTYPPNKWRPPDKNRCGQGMSEFFALLLLKETSSDLTRDAWLSKGKIQDYEKIADSLPVNKNMEKYQHQYDIIDKKLKEQDCYFYPEGGSVFRDYQYMRTRAYQKLAGRNPLSAEDFRALSAEGQKQIAELTHNGSLQLGKFFKPEMTTNQAYQKALELVNRYWW